MQDPVNISDQPDSKQPPAGQGESLTTTQSQHLSEIKKDSKQESDENNIEKELLAIINSLRNYVNLKNSSPRLS